MPKKETTGAGRPSKFTPKLGKAICLAVEKGLTFVDAAKLNGIHKSSISEWRKKGEEGATPELTEFSDALARAHAIRTERRIGVIEQAALGAKPILRIKREPLVVDGILVRDEFGEIVYKETVTEDFISDWKASAWLLDREWAGLYPRKENDDNAEARDQSSKINAFLKAAQELENGEPDAN